MATTTLSAAQLPSSWSQQRRDEYMRYFNDASLRWGVPVQQLINQAYTESTFNPLKQGPLVNGQHAQGITQWLPSTVRDAVNNWGFTPFNPLNPQQAIDATAHFMSLIGTGWFQGYGRPGTPTEQMPGLGQSALSYDPLRASIGYIAGQYYSQNGQDYNTLPSISSSAMDANFNWSQFGPQTLAYGERLSPGAYNVPLALRGATNLNPRQTDQQNAEQALASLAGRLPNLDYSSAAQFINPDGSFNYDLLRTNPSAMPADMFAYFQATGDLAGWGYDLQAHTAQPGAGHAGWDLFRSVDAYVPGLMGPGAQVGRPADWQLPYGIPLEYGHYLQTQGLMPSNLQFDERFGTWSPQPGIAPGTTGPWGTPAVENWIGQNQGLGTQGLQDLVGQYGFDITPGPSGTVSEHPIGGVADPSTYAPIHVWGGDLGNWRPADPSSTWGTPNAVSPYAGWQAGQQDLFFNPNAGTWGNPAPGAPGQIGVWDPTGGYVGPGGFTAPGPGGPEDIPIDYQHYFDTMNIGAAPRDIFNTPGPFGTSAVQDYGQPSVTQQIDITSAQNAAFNAAQVAASNAAQAQHNQNMINQSGNPWNGWDMNFVNIPFGVPGGPMYPS